MFGYGEQVFVRLFMSPPLAWQAKSAHIARRKGRPICFPRRRAGQAGVKHIGQLNHEKGRVLIFQEFLSNIEKSDIYQ
jgi:hypothetical protein